MKAETIQGFPLSPQQRRLWLLQGASQVYRHVHELRLTGPVKLPALQEALRKVVHRHEILRTVFHRPAGMTIPLQVITNKDTCSLHVDDLSHLDHERQESAIQVLVMAERKRPFDFERGPLFEARLIAQSAGYNVLLISLAAMCGDEQTIRNLAREVARCYDCCLRGVALQDEPVQYADVSEVLNELLEAEDTERGREYWHKQDFSGLVKTALPFENYVAKGPGYEPGHIGLEFTHHRAEAIKELIEKHETSAEAFFLACWQILLSRLTAQSALTIGVAFDGRTYEGLEEALGLFARYLPLRCHLEGDSQFLDIVAQAQKTIRDGLEWQDYFSWELIAGSEWKAADPAFFPLGFEFGQGPATHSAGEVGFSLLRRHSCIDRFKLKLSCEWSENAPTAELQYDSNLFSPDDVQRLAEEFQALLESVIRDPGAKIGSLNMVGPAERQQLLRLNETKVDYAPGDCLHQLFERQAVRTPDLLAVICEGQRLTYAQLNAKANQLAHYLQKLGAGPETCVGIAMDRCLEMVIAILGVLKAGAAYVPLELKHPGERLRFMLSDAQVSVLLAQRQHAESLFTQKATIVWLDSDWDMLAGEREQNPSSGAMPDNLVYIIYTSGSTGQPKGVEITHRSLVNYTRFICDRLRLGAAQSDAGPGFATLSSISADLGNTSIFPCLVSGGCLCIPGSDMVTDAGKLASFFSQYPIDLLKIVPSHFNALMDSEEAMSILPRKFLVLGGEVLSFELLRRISDTSASCEVINHYGPTEATVGSITYSPGKKPVRSWRSASVPIGRPIANATAYILDRNLNLVPTGARGELHIGGAGLARGYHRRPDLTADRFIPDPFSGEPGARLYRTGDLARHMPDGNIEFLGRTDHQVKIRGHRVELEEIEAMLRSHPYVRDAVAVMREDEPGIKRLVAYVVFSHDQAPGIDELREFLTLRLPDYMVPGSFMAMKELPLTVNGKVNREALPAPGRMGSRAKKPFSAPVTLAERELADIWSRALRVESVGVYDNFFEMGGDSIIAIQVIARANEIGLRLTPNQIYQHQTISELASVAGDGPAAPADRKPVTGAVPLTPIEYRLLDKYVADPHHFNQALMLELTQALDPRLVREAIRHLLLHHDILRLCLYKESSGWRQVIVEPGGEVPFTEFDMSALPEPGRAIEQTAAQLQTSLNPFEAKLMRVATFDLGAQKSGRLLIIVHHLAVDIASWRILLDDLWTAYQQLSRGEAIELPGKTTSFKEWAERLNQYAKSDKLEQELGYWLAEPRRQSLSLPVDYPNGDNTVRSARTVTTSLGEQETKDLLTRVPRAYNTQINDVLLAAVTRAVSQWTREPRVLIELEGHGREPIFEDVDLSRTVGWFTAVFPLLLSLEGVESEGEVLKAIKEQIRTIPNGGIGYGLLRYVRGDDRVVEELMRQPQAQLIFNYGGQVDQTVSQESPLRLAKESAGPTRSPRGERPHLIQINGMVLQGRLSLSWTYSEKVHRRSTIERVAEECIQALRSFIAHCKSPESGGFTPSDFPGMKFDQRELDELIAELTASVGDEE